MGDVAMTVPVIRAFVQQHPEVKITVVSRPFFQPFFHNIHNVNFYPVDVKGRHKGVMGLLKLYSDLKRLNIDAVADLHNVLRSKVVRTLFALSGKKVAATDKGRADKKELTRAENKIFQPVKSMVERHIDTFGQLGFTVTISNPVFPEKAILSEEVIGVSGQKANQNWIGIAPFAQYQSKVYPLDLMQKVIEKLASNTEYTIFLFGGGTQEAEQLNILAKDFSNCIVVAGKLKLQQELELISNLDVMLSMDSGNAHIAAMLGIQVVTLWGATHPFAGFKPFNQSMDNCLTADREKYPLLPTSVYGNKKVDGYEDAMRTIAPETVVEKIQSLLK
ncbi:lipopolysaccharide heptosyltransferase family protein [Flavobacterium silvisoli]|uniref:Lipopolysaccharide heptosyltransferase family protein n=1 Tax=Flavobacterium silvisoli TaxID=2529433 RepID=A0A4Q9Z4H7_9FLAO|nr:glycosyltransferase family 9 protein [Flavobacterium silvisoli]TBX71364.1 lipopolysaccharide heptosyltransferase family protein [Flavobacterium silvisoli]